MINIRRLLSWREEPAWSHSDILDHPDLQRMSLRELADLPLPRMDEGGYAPQLTPPATAPTHRRT